LFSTAGAALMSDDPEKYFELRSQVHNRSAQRLLKLCQDNGGCFIKVGQHIAALVRGIEKLVLRTDRNLRWSIFFEAHFFIQRFFIFFARYYM
jgi:hypothetical protein